MPNLFPSLPHTGLASSLARTGLHEIQTLISNCEHLGVKLPLLIDLGMVNFIQHFSSVFFCVCSTLATKTRKKSSAARSVLAVGGRYDNLVSLFRRPTSGVVAGATAVNVDSSLAFDGSGGVGDSGNDRSRVAAELRKPRVNARLRFVELLKKDEREAREKLLRRFGDKRISHFESKIQIRTDGSRTRRTARVCQAGRG